MQEGNLYRLEIMRKYLRQPSSEQILSFVKEAGVSYSQFERWFSLKPNTITKSIRREIALPVRYWPLFYSKIIPTYGLSYIEINKALFGNKHELIAKEDEPKETKLPPKQIKPQHTNDAHSRLCSLR